MSAKDTGGAAFPCKVAVDGGINGYVDVDAPGMTLRDYFAAKAMQGLILNDAEDAELSMDNVEAALATLSYRIADAMLAARKEAQ